MGGETQQRLAPRDRNGGQVDLLPRRRVSTCLNARITHETETCSLGCTHARCVCARAQEAPTLLGEARSTLYERRPRPDPMRGGRSGVTRAATRMRTDPEGAHAGLAPPSVGSLPPLLCRPWPQRQHVGRRTHLAPCPPWPQSLTSRPGSGYPASLQSNPAEVSCKFSLAWWGRNGAPSARRSAVYSTTPGERRSPLFNRYVRCVLVHPPTTLVRGVRQPRLRRQQ